MADIEYDAGDASALSDALRTADGVLRGQAGKRSGAVTTGPQDFSGAYAKRFQDAAVIEAEDRGKLAGVLADFADDIDAVSRQAVEERQRISDHDAWKQREAQRNAFVQASGGGVAGVAVPLWEFVTDREPSTTPITPKPLTAAFHARQRPHSAGGDGSGKSSADPTHLRTFVSTTRSADGAADAELQRLQTAWSTFTASCGWAVVDGQSALSGFRQYLQHNESDCTWSEHVATAFEKAGGAGALPDMVLAVATNGRTPPVLDALFAEGLTPAEVAKRWAALGLSKADAPALRALPQSVLEKLGNLEGVAYWARDTANRSVLGLRIDQLESQLATAQTGSAWSGQYGTPFQQQIASLEKELKALLNIEATLGKKASGERHLVSLTDDVPPLAAVSVGDLDTAKNVTWAVPGMNTTTADMSSWTRAAQNIYDRQKLADGDSDRAVISWIGYETPGETTVLGMDKAEAGAEKLAASVHGLDAVRADGMPTTNIVAHSYGTTTAGVALSRSDIHVDRFVALASAGLPDAVDSADDLHAGEVYAGQARNVLFDEGGKGDEWATVGRSFSHGHHVDPSKPAFGATTFGANGGSGLEGNALQAVRHHDPLHADGAGYLDSGTETLYNVAAATTGHDEKLTPSDPIPMTKRDQLLLDAGGYEEGSR
ncbi:alpha/beta hydrolase [Curtobacterium sp. MCPF17_047]|uniref:alpha/beta hydrolase n=1 Tax=Curtobacterium sp. MCPF17_047 TaxID=2175654 RepID=UPI0015E8B503|nr:alpha/beta hydrolase [Curtobacterium sp. MCPF17_047]